MDPPYIENMTIDGKACTLEELVRREPQWAANEIRRLTRLLAAGNKEQKEHVDGTDNSTLEHRAGN